MKKSNATKINRKSRYNPKRPHYLTEDGRFYVYEYWDCAKNRMVKDEFEVGKDISLELVIKLDEYDWEMDNTDRKEEALRDPLFDAKVNTYCADPDSEDAINPWDTIPDKDGNPEDVLFTEPEPENPQETIVRRVIEENCTEAQRDLFYRHYGMCEQLEQIRQDEIEATGKTISNAAMTQRVNKILDKTAKALGTERVKRHKYPSKD